MKKIILILMFLAISLDLIALGEQNEFESEEYNFTLTKIVDGLRHPWSLAELPNEEGILITIRPGELFLFDNESLREIKGLPPVAAIGQGGLLDIILDPDFQSNRVVYFSFAESGSGGYGTAVARAVYDNFELNEVKIIFRADPKSSGGVHFGSRLAFGSDGLLYITLGERGQMNNAQDLSHDGGSVVRIDSSGNIPSDNPYNEIFSYGHRNAQGMALNKETGQLWLHEHGPKGGDEVNIVRRGANYGWPLVTYGIDYNGSIISDKTTAPGIEEPVIYWIPSIAPSGMTFYYSNDYPKWNGNIFVGALAGRHLRRLVTNGDEIVHQEILLKNSIGRIRDVRATAVGGLYILTDENNGALYKLEPSK